MYNDGSWSLGISQSAYVGNARERAYSGLLRDYNSLKNNWFHSMTEQAKPGPDYSGQKLAGRSFRGQALRGANFQKSDLRGVDFRDADLTGADFSGARMGKTWRRRLMELPVQFVLGVLL